MALSSDRPDGTQQWQAWWHSAVIGLMALSSDRPDGTKEIYTVLQYKVNATEFSIKIAQVNLYE